MLLVAVNPAAWRKSVQMVPTSRTPHAPPPPSSCRDTLMHCCRRLSCPLQSGTVLPVARMEVLFFQAWPPAVAGVPPVVTATGCRPLHLPPVVQRARNNSQSQRHRRRSDQSDSVGARRFRPPALRFVCVRGRGAALQASRPLLCHPRPPLEGREPVQIRSCLPEPERSSAPLMASQPNGTSVKQDQLP